MIQEYHSKPSVMYEEEKTILPSEERGGRLTLEWKNFLSPEMKMMSIKYLMKIALY
jgi:hypothetical protein